MIALDGAFGEAISELALVCSIDGDPTRKSNARDIPSIFIDFPKFNAENQLGASRWRELFIRLLLMIKN